MLAGLKPSSPKPRLHLAVTVIADSLCGTERAVLMKESGVYLGRGRVK